MLDIVIMEPLRLVSCALKNVFAERSQVKDVLSSLSELKGFLAENKIDLVVMELYSREDSLFDGIEFSKQFQQNWPDVKLLIITDLEQPSLLLRLLKQNTLSIISKQDSPLVLGLAVDALKSEQRYISPYLQAFLDNLPRRLHYALTDMEWQVLWLMSLGQSVDVISHGININYKTVQGHKRNFMRKMDISCNAQLIALLKRYGRIYPK